MFAAALMDPQPLLRLGLARILGAISSIGEIHTYDPELLDPTGGPLTSLSVQILLFGLSGDDRHDQLLLDRMIALTAPRHILLLTDELRVPQVRHASVAGRIRRSAPSDLVEAAVKLILAGGRCFPDTLHAEDGPVSVEPTPVVPATLLPGPRLIAQGSRELRITPRQFEILVLRAHGMSLKAVGRALGISEATVKAHASSMYRRLDVTNCQEAIQLATRRGVNLLPGDGVARTGASN